MKTTYDMFMIKTAYSLRKQFDLILSSVLEITYKLALHDKCLCYKRSIKFFYPNKALTSFCT